MGECEIVLWSRFELVFWPVFFLDAVVLAVVSSMGEC